MDMDTEALVEGGGPCEGGFRGGAASVIIHVEGGGPDTQE